MRGEGEDYYPRPDQEVPAEQREKIRKMTEEKRIYVIVDETVQNPLSYKITKDMPIRVITLPNTDTKTIVPPKGRIAAQVALSTSMRMKEIEYIGRSAYTTIILGVSR